jgi:hypothetical protein
MPWHELLTWDWATIVKTIVGAGIGAASAQWLRDSRHRKRQAAYMAMRLAVVLEAYAISCSLLIVTNETAEPPPDRDFGGSAALPELPPYPDDDDGWRAVDRKLAGRCLSLRNRIRESQTFIGWTIEFNDYDLKEEVYKQVADRGLEAWQLANEMRSKHGVESAKHVWDPLSHLESAQQRVERRRKERQAREDAARQATPRRPRRAQPLDEAKPDLP